MAMTSLADPPNGSLLSILDEQFPCRYHQLQNLATVLCPDAAPCRNCIVYGTKATGKSAIVAALLQQLRHGYSNTSRNLNYSHLQYAIVNSVECITQRHLLETTLHKVADALSLDVAALRCESLVQLTFELSRMLKDLPQPDRRHFVLVFDGIDGQKEASPALLSALAKLSDIIPCLTTVFIVTDTPPIYLLTTFATHVRFPNYTRANFLKILSMKSPHLVPNATEADTADLWGRFCAAVHDSQTIPAARTLPALQRACNFLWCRFTAPIREGSLGPKDFPQLLVASRVHFQDESFLVPGITQHPFANTKAESDATTLASLLPITARILLVTAFLASHNTMRHDFTLFSTCHNRRRRSHGGSFAFSGVETGRRTGPRSRHRRIERKLLGAHTFVLERALAILMAVQNEWGTDGISGTGIDADIGMALVTLSSLRLLVRIGTGGDLLDRSGKWRVNVGWEVVRGLGRSIGVEVEQWLVE